MCRPILPLATYLIYQDFIIEYLCINKDKPKMQCNGKCYLSKQLEKEEEKRKNAPKIQLEDYPIGFVFFLIFKNNKIEEIVANEFICIENYSFRPTFEIFHPPTA